MVNRRRVLIGVAGTVSLAGCSGGGSGTNTEGQNETQEETNEQSENDSETDTTGLSNEFRISNVELSYRFSSGLGAEMRLYNEATSGRNSANIAIEVYDGDGLIGEDSLWQDVKAEFYEVVELTISSVSATADSDIEDVTDFVIKGKLRNGEYGELQRLSGDELRERVDS